MSGLLFLSSNDFVILKGLKGDILCNFIPGISLIMFYSNSCENCKNLIPIFKQLPGNISGCQFGLVNLSQNKNIIEMSFNTITPIEFVPYIVLFNDGKPFIRYTGPHNIKCLTQFIVEIAGTIKSRNKGINRPNQQQNQSNQSNQHQSQHQPNQPNQSNQQNQFQNQSNQYAQQNQQLPQHRQQYTQQNQQAQQRLNQQTNDRIKHNSRTGIPDYTIGHPICGEDGVCYLDMNSAYTKLDTSEFHTFQNNYKGFDYAYKNPTRNVTQHKIAFESGMR
jgi:thiol-disulfide isomerase/thioredoxin